MTKQTTDARQLMLHIPTFAHRPTVMKKMKAIKRRGVEAIFQVREKWKFGGRGGEEGKEACLQLLVPVLAWLDNGGVLHLEVSVLLIGTTTP